MLIVGDYESGFAGTGQLFQYPGLIKANTTYKLEGRIGNPGSADWFQADVFASDTGVHGVNETLTALATTNQNLTGTPSAQEWDDFSIEFDSADYPNAVDQYLKVQVKGRRFAFDEVSLRSYLIEDVLDNGSFEDDSISDGDIDEVSSVSDWMMFYSVYLSNPNDSNDFQPTDGNNLLIVGDYENGLAGTGQVFQYYGLIEPDTTYKLEGSIGNPNDASWFQADLYASDTGVHDVNEIRTTLATTNQTSTGTPNANEWQDFSIEFDSADDPNAVGQYLKAQIGGRRFAFDNLKLTITR